MAGHRGGAKPARRSRGSSETDHGQNPRLGTPSRRRNAPRRREGEPAGGQAEQVKDELIDEANANAAEQRDRA